MVLFLIFIIFFKVLLKIPLFTDEARLLPVILLSIKATPQSFGNNSLLLISKLLLFFIFLGGQQNIFCSLRQGYTTLSTYCELHWLKETHSVPSGHREFSEITLAET